MKVGVICQRRDGRFNVTVTKVDGNWVYWERTTSTGNICTGRCRKDNWSKVYK